VPGAGAQVSLMRAHGDQGGAGVSPRVGGGSGVAEIIDAAVTTKTGQVTRIYLNDSIDMKGWIYKSEQVINHHSVAVPAGRCIWMGRSKDQTVAGAAGGLAPVDGGPGGLNIAPTRIEGGAVAVDIGAGFTGSIERRRCSTGLGQAAPGELRRGAIAVSGIVHSIRDEVAVAAKDLPVPGAGTQVSLVRAHGDQRGAGVSLRVGRGSRIQLAAVAFRTGGR